MIERDRFADHDPATEFVLQAIDDEDLRLATVRIFAEAQHRIDAGQVNLVIIAARRLACLYQLLLRAGMPSLTGCTVASNRILEADPDFDWASTNVLILDDSVVVGTTLHRLRDELQKFGAASSSCLAVCIDIEQRVDYLLDGEFEALLERDSASVSTYSKQVVQSLFSNQVPFFTDYPTTVPVSLAKDSWTSYLGDERWHVADVTAPLLEDGIHAAYAQIPTEETFARVLSGVDPKAAALVDGLKVRLYAADEGDSVRVVVVPIALLGPCAPSELDAALHAICDATLGEGHDAAFDHALWDVKAKHRLIQLYVSACVLAEVWPRLTLAAFGQAASPTISDLEDQQIRLYFGDLTDRVFEVFSAVVKTYSPSDEAAVVPTPRQLEQPTPSQFLDKDGVRDLLWDVREVIVATGIPVQPDRGDLTKLGLLFAHGITAIFGYVNRVYELPQRMEIASLPNVSAYDKLYADRSRRLLYQGFTLRELTAAVAPECLQGSPWRRAIVSLGIDAGNDLGVIVPTTRHDESRGLVYRCYRLGETANLADRPLSEVVRQAEPQLDEMARAAEAGFPIESTSRPIEQALASPDRSGSVDKLVDRVRRAIPGVAISRFVGTVTAVQGDRFQADLRSPALDDFRVAEMPLDQLLPDTAAAFTPGIRFLWTVRQDDRDGVRTRHSSIRPLELVPLDVDRLIAVGAAVTKERLAHDDPPGS